MLAPAGELLLMVPIAEGWKETFEDRSVTTDEARRRYFAQNDHIRYYGADLRDRIRVAGFALSEFSGTGRQAGAHSLVRGETVFKASVA